MVNPRTGVYGRRDGLSIGPRKPKETYSPFSGTGTISYIMLLIISGLFNSSVVSKLTVYYLKFRLDGVAER